MNEEPEKFIGKKVIYGCNHFSPSTFDRRDEAQTQKSWNRIRRAVRDPPRNRYDRIRTAEFL